MRRSGPLRRRKRLQRRAALRRSPFSPASRAQRDKVRAPACLVCGARLVDPAHLVPRSLGGCDDPDCVLPLCRSHHRMYDRGELDLLAALERRFRCELAHGLLHVGLLGLLGAWPRPGGSRRTRRHDVTNRQELCEAGDAVRGSRHRLDSDRAVHALNCLPTVGARLLFFVPERHRGMMIEATAKDGQACRQACQRWHGVEGKGEVSGPPGFRLSRTRHRSRVE
jgi:HNH endonuclease